jgi:hypothetical protein
LPLELSVVRALRKKAKYHLHRFLLKEPALHSSEKQEEIFSLHGRKMCLEAVRYRIGTRLRKNLGNPG